MGERCPDGRQEVGSEPRLNDIAEPARIECGPGEVDVFVDREEDQARRPVRAPALARRFAAQMPACDQRSPLRGVLHAAVAGTNRASPARKEALMELMEVYHEAMAAWGDVRSLVHRC